MQFLGQTVPRIGYGTMRLTGPKIMGPPKDRDEAIAVLKRAVELGIRVIDTSWYYGPFVANEILAEALHPYPKDLVIISKLGASRTPEGDWIPFIKPEQLREGIEHDLRTLKLDSVPVVHFRWLSHMGLPELGPEFTEAIDTMLAMKAEGKFQHLGLSTVSVAQLEYVLARSPVVTVSNAYSCNDRRDEAMVEKCEKLGITYLPYFPLGAGQSDKLAVLEQWAKKLDISPTQLALAWLLHRSPVILPIPGTSTRAHLEENTASQNIKLTQECFDAISGETKDNAQNPY